MTPVMEITDSRPALSRMKDLLVDFPSLVKLIYRLLRDRRVSRWDKLILAGVMAYILNPMDLLPDAIPLLGQIDDAYLLAMALLRLLNRSDEQVLRKHWHGKRDIVLLLQEITQLAVFYLPRKTRTILVGKAGLRGTQAG